LHDYFTKTLSNGEYIGIIAERNGKILGIGGMVLWRIPPRYGAHISGRRGYIVNMYTIPRERKHGISSRIIQELIKHARILGIAYLHLHASEDGIGVYQKAGFSAAEQVELDLTVE
jgi:GNAT superfamily N-acetyltransferase